MTNNRRDYKYKGLHFSDPFFEWVRGFGKRTDTTRDALQFSNETINSRNDLFPLRSIPVKDKPGYVRYNLDYFRITNEDQKIQTDLNNYFLNEHYMPRDKGISYTSSGNELGNLFNQAYSELVIHGVSAYAIEWSMANIDGRCYKLPIDFIRINPATLFLKNGGNIAAEQRYSWVSRNAEEYFNYEDHSFKSADIIVFKHPHSFPGSPVDKSLKHLKGVRRGLKFSLKQGEASNNPDNHSMDLERTRHIPSSDIWRKQSISRLKVKRIFKLQIGQSDVGLTNYYVAHSYAEHLKELNDMRDSVIESFSNQLFSEIQKNNNIPSKLSLEHRGFKSNYEVDKSLERYKNREITANVFVELLKDRINDKLY